MQTPRNNNSDNKPAFTPEQLQQLMSLQANTIKGGKPKDSFFSQKTLVKISNVIQKTMHHLDRFINFTTKPTDKDRNDVLQSARSPILFGLYVVVFFVFIGGLWTSFAPLDSAAVAIGTVVSNTSKKLIQHHEGGIISAIFVSQGDKVKEGDKLLELESVRIKSQYDSTLSQYRHDLAAESRLIAERDGLEEIVFPPFLTESQDSPEVQKIIHTQENLFKSKKESFKAEKNALHQRVEQLSKKLEGVKARKTAVIKNWEIAKDRLNSIKTLYAKGIVQRAGLLEIEGKEASARSEMAMADSDIAATMHAITESEITMINLQNKYSRDTLTELKQVQSEGANNKEKFNASSDSLKRVVIRSPVEGVVNAINYHTIGGYIPPGQTIVEISPANDVLIIEAKISPKDIDAIHEGLVAKIRFSAFKSRTTPLFTGKVINLSPDLVIDREANPGSPDRSNYIARIEIDMEEFNKLAKEKKLQLHPGMQAEVQIVRGTRTLLRYLLDPLVDTMFKAFKEK